MKSQAKRIEQFKAVQKRGLELFEKKNTDYGDAFADFGVVGIIIRVQDKMRRFISVSANGAALVNDEGLRDTLIDMANYATMALMLMDEQEKGTPTVLTTHDLLEIDEAKADQCFAENDLII